MSKYLPLVAYMFMCLSMSGQEEVAMLLNAPELPEETSSSIIYSEGFENFDLVGGLVFVDALMDGEKTKFILDTGSPSLIINQKPQDFSEQFIASGLTGNASIGETTISEFKILSIIKSNYQAYQMDLGHIENEILHKFNGLVGQDVFKNSVLILNYNEKKWGVRNKFEADESWSKVNFELVEHFVIINLDIDDRNHRMVIDTGAEINLLDKKAYRALNKKVITSSSELSVQGASIENVGSPCAVLDKITLNEEKYFDQTFSIIDFSFINEGIDDPFDGLLGFPFFEDKEIAIDFKNQVLYLK